MAWMRQTSPVGDLSYEETLTGWPVNTPRFTAMTRQQFGWSAAHSSSIQQLASMARVSCIDYGTFFNFIPVSQTRNIRWLTGCGFTFHTHPEIETDMRLFTLGPDGDRIAADPAFWADYLGTDFADSWGD